MDLQSIEKTFEQLESLIDDLPMSTQDFVLSVRDFFDENDFISVKQARAINNVIAQNEHIFADFIDIDDDDY